MILRRISNLVRGFLSLFISGLERKNPEALLELEKENLREAIARYNQGLATHAGLCEKLMAQVKRLESEQRELRAKTTALLKSGSQQAAGQYAIRYQTVSRELEENKSQLESAEKTYQELLQARDVSVNAARAKIEALKAGIDDLKIKKAMAELNTMAAGMINTIGGSGDTLNRLHEMVEEDRQKAAGEARVARDSMDMSGIKLKAAEQDALASDALAAFAAAEGIHIEGLSAAPGSAAPAPEQKTMGPVPEKEPEKE